MDEADVVKALGALAQPVRLQVFRALVVTGNAGLTPGIMAEALAIPQNTLSFHLKELASAGSWSRSDRAATSSTAPPTTA
jgi:DNA-binding transcriptional ArsR family regulator